MPEDKSYTQNKHGPAGRRVSDEFWHKAQEALKTVEWKGSLASKVHSPSCVHQIQAITL